eukprot:878526_1
MDEDEMLLRELGLHQNDSDARPASVSLVKERIIQYKKAYVMAKKSGDEERVERLKDDIQELLDALEMAKHDMEISVGELPPSLESKKPSKPNSPSPAKSAPASDSKSEKLKELNTRLVQSKTRAVQLKRAGKKAEAIQEMRTMKQLQHQIAMFKSPDAESLRASALAMAKQAEAVSKLAGELGSVGGDDLNESDLVDDASADATPVTSELVKGRIAEYRQALQTGRGNSAELRENIGHLNEAIYMMDQGMELTEAEIPPALAEASLSPEEPESKESAIAESPAADVSKENDLADLNLRLREAKIRTIKLKKEGRKAEAIQEYRRVKEIQNQIDDFATAPEIQPVVEESREVKSEVIEERKTLENEERGDCGDLNEVTLTRQLSMSGNADDVTPATTEIVNHRIKLYKQALRAAEHKGESGKCEEFREQLQYLAEALEMIAEGMELTIGEIPPEIEPVDAPPSPKPAETPLKNEKSSSSKKLTLEAIEERTKQFKLSAVRANRAGDTDRAMEMMRAYKKCAACATRAQAGDTITDEDLPEALDEPSKDGPKSTADSAPTVATENETRKVSIIVPVERSAGKEDESLKIKSVEESEEDIGEVIKRRIGIYTKSASHYKATNDITTAMDVLRQVIVLEKFEERLKAGEAFEISELPAEDPTEFLSAAKKPAPKTPKSSQSPSQSAPKTRKKKKSDDVDVFLEALSADSVEIEETAKSSRKPKKPEKRLSKADTKKYAQIIKALKSQINELDEASKALMRADMKPRALKLHVMKKRMMVDLKSAESMQSQKLPPSGFRKEKRKIWFELRFPEIAFNHIQMKIVRCQRIKFPHGYKTLSPYIYFSTDIPSKENPQTGQTDVGKSPTDPEFNFKQTIKIERTKGVARKFRFMKVHFDLYHKRPVIRDVLVGSAEFRLAPLLQRSEVVTDIEFKEKRKTIAVLTVELRVSSPLLGKDIREGEREYIFFSGNDNKKAPSRSSTAPSDSRKVERKEPSTGQKARSPAPKLTRQPSKIPPLPPGITEAQVANPHDPSLLVSNNVMEIVIARIDKQLTGFAKEGQKYPPELVQKKFAVQKVLQILEARVQAEVLTVPQYISQLTAGVKRDTALTVALKHRNRIQDAKLVYERVKIMMKEIAECKQMVEG